MAEFTDDEDDFIPDDNEEDDDFVVDEDEDFDPDPPPAKKKAKKAAAKKKKAKTTKSTTKAPSTPKVKRKASSKTQPTAKKTKQKASAKGSVKVVKGKAHEVIYEYMHKVNRPYNATGIFENLHRAVPRKQVDAALEKLCKSGQIRMKAYGKTKIFWLNQDVFEALNPEELQALEDEAKSMQTEVDTLKRANHSLSQQLSQSEASMTDDALDEAIANLKVDLAETKEKMEKYGNQAAPDPNLLKNQAAEMKKYLKLWKLRKRALMDFVGQVADSQLKKDKQVLKDMECETDEEAGFKPKDFSNFIR